jgi:hypothetical protein
MRLIASLILDRCVASRGFVSIVLTMTRSTSASEIFRGAVGAGEDDVRAQRECPCRRRSARPTNQLLTLLGRRLYDSFRSRLGG